jgi:hypothetical protein
MSGNQPETVGKETLRYGGKVAAGSREVSKVSNHRFCIAPTVYGTKGWDKCVGHPQQRAWAHGVSCAARAADWSSFKLKGGTARFEAETCPGTPARSGTFYPAKAAGRSVIAC